MSLIERTFILIKPDKVNSELAMTDLISSINKNGLIVIRYDLIKLDPECIDYLYPDKATSKYKDENVKYMTSGDCGLLQILGDNSIRKMLLIKGKTNSFGMRKKYSKDFIYNGFHCPDSQNDCLRELDIIRVGGEINVRNRTDLLKNLL